MRRSTVKLLSIISAVIFLIIACAFIPSGNAVASYITLLIYLPIALVLLYFQRCPHCGRWPRKGDFFDSYCPRCGKPLDD